MIFASALTIAPRRLSITLFAGLMLICHTGTSDSEPGAGDVTWSDSIFLLQNIFKDLAKEEGVVEQYKLFIRADATYKAVRDDVTDTERQKINRRLQQAFRRLPAPAELIINDEIKFRLIIGRAGRFYWSEAVSQGLCLQFLNEQQVATATASRIESASNGTIKFDDDNGYFVSTAPNKPLPGIDFELAKDITRWVVRRWHMNISLPTAEMAAACSPTGLSCWTKSKWKEKDDHRQEAWKMFGGQFYTLFHKGREIGELPEAFYPEARLHWVATEKSGKLVYLRNLSEADL